jgi:cysteine synthase A
MADKRWSGRAVELLAAEAEKAGPTPLVRFPLPSGWGVELWFKDESQLPSRTVKHRHARALFRYAIACGQINEGTSVIEATGGGAAVADAYMAALLSLDFTAVMPGKENPLRGAGVREYGGECRFVEPPLAIYETARKLADELGGHYLDQFGMAERALDWGDDGLAGELFDQLRDPPEWIVVGAGTGATSATLGRYVRGHGLPSQLAVVDPENSAYYPGWVTGAPDYATGMPSAIEGIGRPRMEPGFLPSLVDLMIPVPDAGSIAAARALRTVTGLPVGGSSGTNLLGAFTLIARMLEQGRQGTVVSLIADAADRHLSTVHSAEWAAGRGLNVDAYEQVIHTFLTTGSWRPPRPA